MQRAVAVVLVSVLLSGCAFFGGKSTNGLADGETFAAPERSAQEAQLRRIVSNSLAKAPSGGSPSSADFVRKKPHFYREYVEYPDGPQGYSVDIRATASRTTPLIAEVTADKIRFATRPTRNRDTARSDRNFIRNTGIERTTYEYAYGEWRRIGSLFVADKSEELRGGEWIAIEEAPLRFDDPDERKSGGFLNKLMFWR